MSSTSRIIDIARRALSAQQTGLSVTGHNIANVNTPGYTRQRLIMAPNTTEPNSRNYSSWGFFGAGVSIQTVERIRNSFIDLEIQAEKQEFNRWNYRERYYVEIENIYNEPSDSGLSSVMTGFWDSWEELANDPQSWAARERLKQGGVSLANTLNYLNKRFTDLQRNLDDELVMRVEEVNSLLDRIAGLNLRVTSSESRGIRPNELRDQRDNLVEELSGLVNVRVSENERGSLTVSLGGRTLIERDSVFKLGTSERSLGYAVVHDVTWEHDGSPISIASGMIKGITEMRDEIITDELDHIDTLAAALVSGVNDLHTVGFGMDGTDGNVFFDSRFTSASDIAVDASILADLNKIAASGDGSAGDGSAALQIADLRETEVMTGNTASIEDYFGSVIAAVGVQSQEASFMRENQALMVEQLENQRSSISGVSLDEEMMNIVKFQHAYEAAAKLVSTVDEMLGTIIEMV